MTNKLLGGTTLVIDRYAYSGIAYSAAKVCSLLFNIASFSLSSFTAFPLFLNSC